jgi:uncharacterized protein
MEMHPSSRSELLAAIEANPRLRSVYQLAISSESEDAAHDGAHLLRVALWTLRFAQVDFEEAVCAALLHDLVNIPKNHPDRAKASEFSAIKSEEFLRSLGFPEDSILRVTEAIRQHSYSRGEIPSSPLAKALQDADRLEAIGAIGLMRVFSTGARMGAKYFDANDPWGKKRELDDRAFSIDHFFTKLLLLEKTMTTEAGRAEAEKRTKILRDFLANLAREIGEAP